MPLVVDWSHWVPIRDAHALRNAGIAGAIGKVSDGAGGADRTWIPGRDACRSAGLPTSGYHFYRLSQSPQANAQAFLGHYGDPKLCALPPVLDAEDPGASVGRRGQNADDLLTFLRLVEQATGRVPMIYSGRFWWGPYVAARQEFARFPTWHAAYPRNDSTPPERLKAPAGFLGRPPTMWQFTSRWPVAGMAGLCDCSVVSGENLASLIAGPLTPQPQSDHPTPTPKEWLDMLSADQQTELLDNSRKARDDAKAARAEAGKAHVLAQAALDQLESTGKGGDRRGPYLPRLRDDLAAIHAAVIPKRP